MKSSPADVLLIEGEKHLDAGEWADAEAAFRRAVEVDRTSAAALSKLGVALVRQGRTDEAEQAFTRAVAVDPRYAPAWSNLGNVHRERGKTEEALGAYQRAIAADPDYWVAHQNLGGLYKQMGRTSDAIAALRKATKLSVRGAVTRPTGAGGRRLGCLGGSALVVVLMSATAVALRILTAF